VIAYSASQTRMFDTLNALPRARVMPCRACVHSLARAHTRTAGSPKKTGASPSKQAAATNDDADESAPEGLGSMKREKTFAAFEITDDGPKKGAKPPARLLAKKKGSSVAKEDVDTKLTAAEERRKQQLNARVAQQQAEEDKRANAKRSLIAKKREGSKKIERKLADADDKRHQRLDEIASAGGSLTMSHRCCRCRCYHHHHHQTALHHVVPLLLPPPPPPSP
jgi:hypothetical protein